MWSHSLMCPNQSTQSPLPFCPAWNVRVSPFVLNSWWLSICLSFRLSVLRSPCLNDRPKTHLYVKETITKLFLFINVNLVQCKKLIYILIYRVSRSINIMLPIIISCISVKKNQNELTMQFHTLFSYWSFISNVTSGCN